MPDWRSKPRQLRKKRLNMRFDLDGTIWIEGSKLTQHIANRLWANLLEDRQTRQLVEQWAKAILHRHKERVKLEHHKTLADVKTPILKAAIQHLDLEEEYGTLWRITQ